MEATTEAQLSRPKLILLDVYETLLDLSEIQNKVNAMLNSRRGYRVWFELFIQYCFADNATGLFHPFADIAKATLAMAAHGMGVHADERKQDEIVWLLRHAPLKQNVQEGLSQLNDQGYILAALTNAPQSIVADRMEPTGLVSYFEFVLSTEQIKKYKPAQEVYQWALKKAGVPAGDVLLVSAHSWDIMGAATAGLQTAYLGQDKLFYALAPEPNYRAADLVDLAAQLNMLYSSVPSAHF
jgi:2-haloacid dehalogenase